jgi:predicted transglutaminase-like protease
MAEYQNRDITQGALFINDRKKQALSPDFRGELTLSKALLKELVGKVKEGKEAKLALSVWKKKSAAGNEYQSVAASIFIEYKKDGSEDIEVPF